MELDLRSTNFNSAVGYPELVYARVLNGNCIVQKLWIIKVGPNAQNLEGCFLVGLGLGPSAERRAPKI